MKKIMYLTLSIICITLLFSCSQKEGDWDDNIRLSKKNIEFSNSADSVTITTGGTGWWINSASVNNQMYYDFTPETVEGYTYKIQRDCFIIERRNKNTLFIQANENADSINRKIVVYLQAGDYFSNITINQKHK